MNPTRKIFKQTGGVWIGGVWIYECKPGRDMFETVILAFVSGKWSLFVVVSLNVKLCAAQLFCAAGMEPKHPKKKLVESEFQNPDSSFLLQKQYFKLTSPVLLSI